MKNRVNLLLVVVGFCVAQNELAETKQVGYDCAKLLAQLHAQSARYLIACKKGLDTKKLEDGLKRLNQQCESLISQSLFAEPLEILDDQFGVDGASKVRKSKNPALFNILWEIQRANSFNKLAVAFSK